MNTEQFIKLNPFCIFCGGAVAATSKEHCPPKALFQSKSWPEGFEFPACKGCNNDASDDDLLVAMLARLDPLDTRGDGDGRMLELIKNIQGQHGGLLQQMFELSSNEARRFCREMGIKPEPGLTYKEMGFLRIPERVNEAVKVLGRKLTKAIYYKEVGSVFPGEGGILFHWFTNKEVLKNGSIFILDLLAGFDAKVPKIVRNGKDLSGQFDYRWLPTIDSDVAAVKVIFGRSFGFVAIASPTKGLLLGWLENIKKSMPGGDGNLSLI